MWSIKKFFGHFYGNFIRWFLLKRPRKTIKSQEKKTCKHIKRVMEAEHAFSKMMVWIFFSYIIRLVHDESIYVAINLDQTVASVDGIMQQLAKIWEWEMVQFREAALFATKAKINFKKKIKRRTAPKESCGVREEKIK